MDKDIASGLLAHDLGAELLMIPTGVPRVAIGFGTPDEKWLDSITVEEARDYIASGQFGKGSMEPKVEAVADFVATTPGATGVIGAAEEIPAILAGTSGTRIVGDGAAATPLRTSRQWCSAAGGQRNLDARAQTLAEHGRRRRHLRPRGHHRTGLSDLDVNDDHPAMIRVTDGSGVAVAVEVWSVPAAGLAGILLNEPPGLSIGKVNLADGSTVLGVIGEPALVEGQREISQHGGWRAYTAAEGVSS